MIETVQAPPQDNYFRDLEDYVKMVAAGNNKSLFVIGDGGMGKTQTVLDTLRDNNQPYAHFTTFTTPLELYSYLYIHRNDLIVMDDMEGVLDNKKSVGILKSCLWGYEDRNVVQYLSSTSLLMVPPRFEFSGRTIFLLNEFPKNKFVASLITRSIYYELKIPYATKLLMMDQIARKDFPGMSLADRMEVLEYIKRYSSEATSELNFRTLIKAFNMFTYSRDRWQPLVRVMLKADDDLANLKTIQDTMGDLNVSQQARLFSQNTGKGRSTFFRLKKKLMNR